MRNHVYRPLIVLVALVVLVFIVRVLAVPNDFGAQEMGYRFGWHRKGNEQEWKDFKAKYKELGFCNGCHQDKAKDISGSPHVVIPCQNCHGPALDHPLNPPTLTVDRTRGLCLRCHAKLPYKGSGREAIRGIENEAHYPESACVMCHNPHSPAV